ncbi:MAG: epoxyqueuosine reductase QueH [Syntrophomonadaceae bacterium]|nr:epoxyqueuosine reductase QueH [Syntrophomonadaceae bacterium]
MPAQSQPKVLLHVCCGPCATYPLPSLRNEGFEVMGYYYNPNIHPYTEYLKRRESLEKFAEAAQLKLILDPDYDAVKYFQQISYRETQRCRVCYQMRLEKAAHIAARGKFDYFTSTLLVSTYQNHNLIKETGQAMGEKYGVPFLYRDFREGFKQTIQLSRDMGLYRQQYCGCLYSELERYAGRNVNKAKETGKLK